MNKKVSEKEAQSVLSLSPIDRYKHTIKTISDWEEVWGLYKDGWALVGDKEDNQFLPIWPAEKYAEMCSKEEWIGYEPKSISLQYLLDNFLVDLKKNNINLSIFYTFNSSGIIATPEQFEADLREELLNYE